MRTISETLDRHRRTRGLYMKAAREAKVQAVNDYGRSLPVPAWHYVEKRYVWTSRMIDPHAAMRCFLRHARAANRKLVAVKRFNTSLSRAISLGYEPYGTEVDHFL